MAKSPLPNTEAHEQVHIIDDASTGLRGMIAIHSTTLGPAAGGCRLWRYENAQAMERDALRLSRGMSYKNAMAGLPFGGGKAVLQLPAEPFDRDALFAALGNAVEALDGRYITAEDVGTTLEDMKVVSERTRFVAGLKARRGKAGGDPSPWTALGVFEAMKVASSVALGADLEGLTVAVQGTGNVGASLCRMLANAGVKLVIADIDRRRVALLERVHGARVVPVDEIASVQADIFAPCALGGVLNAKSIPQLKARLVCGGANNQLATEADGDALTARGIAYAPDYVVNAGGIINVTAEYLGETTQQVEARVHCIAGRLDTVLKLAAVEKVSSARVADRLAQQIIREAERQGA